ncbi:MAG TPA: DUF6526 family protein [Chitinophagaceae bacterium]
MEEQNFKNHARIHPVYHYVTIPALLALLIGSIVNLANSSAQNIYSASLLVLVSLILIIVYWFTRSFALKAQDRAIRAEENFRHFILSGKPFDSSITTGQIIALRFAGDDEFLHLAQKAANENLSPKEIKMLVKNWRADYHRV